MSYSKNDIIASIIVVNFNGDSVLCDCVSSILKQSYQNYEIIIVDNFSSDNSINRIKKEFSDNRIKIIKCKKNNGFALGNNIGILNSSGQYIITLNSDTIVIDNWLQELIETADANPKVGMVASKIFLDYDQKILDSVGVNIYPDGMSKQRGHLVIDSGQFDDNTEIFFPSACAALYRKSMLEKIGCFDEDFFLYCEDTDLGLRARVAGFDARLAPRAHVHHKHSATMGKYAAKKAFYIERNHIWLVVKNFPISYLLLLPFYSVYRILSMAFNLRKNSSEKNRLNSKKIIFWIIIGYFSMIIKLPKMFQKRIMIAKNRNISYNEYLRLLKTFSLNVKDLKI